MLVLPLMFTLFEWLRGYVLTGFPWLQPGYAQIDTWLSGYAHRKTPSTAIADNLYARTLLIDDGGSKIVVVSTDLLWVPLRPKPSRQKGNESGNPYVDVNRVLAIWRDSVPEDVRKLVDMIRNLRAVKRGGGFC